MSKRDIERRYLPASELRATQDGNTRKLIGYAAMFDKPSQPIPIGNGRTFVERIRPGAFGKCMAQDVRCLWNHDANHVLGRTKARTLTLFEDEIGLRMECTLPDTQDARDLWTKIERGDVDQMSFAFNVADGGDEWSENEQGICREIREFSDLYDVSPVTYAAYLDTTVSARSLEAARRLSEPPAPAKTDPLPFLRQQLAELD